MRFNLNALGQPWLNHQDLNVRAAPTVVTDIVTVPETANASARTNVPAPEMVPPLQVYALPVEVIVTPSATCSVAAPCITIQPRNV